MDCRVQRVIELIGEDIRRELPLQVLARSVNLSPSRLRHLFKAETGLTPARYLKLLRMDKARELAVSTFLNIRQIIKQLGSRDQSHFVRDFKRTYGMTFKQYRSGYGRTYRSGSNLAQRSIAIPANE